MSINEFKNNINLIMDFIFRINEEKMPYNIKKVMVKTYANTLKINLTSNMIDSLLFN